jgi:hypothetical protein
VYSSLILFLAIRHAWQGFIHLRIPELTGRWKVHSSGFGNTRCQGTIFAISPIWARGSGVDDPAEPHIVEAAERLGRDLNNHRPLSQVHNGHVVDGIGVITLPRKPRLSQIAVHDEVQQQRADLKRVQRARSGLLAPLLSFHLVRNDPHLVAGKLPPPLPPQ